jgi:putative phosphoesterase
MKLGLISDTHGAVAPVVQLLEGPFTGSELVLHAGDVLYHGPRNPLPETYNPARLAEVINSSPAPFVIARGNCDSSVDQFVLDAPLLAPYALIQWEGLRLLINHGDLCTSQELAAEASRLGARVALFGHIHTPVLEEVNGVLLVNPGSPALPKYEIAGRYIPTYGLIEAGKVLLCRLDNDEELFSAVI